jgi:hypothetical protein
MPKNFDKLVKLLSEEGDACKVYLVVARARRREADGLSQNQLKTLAGFRTRPKRIPGEELDVYLRRRSFFYEVRQLQAGCSMLGWECTCPKFLQRSRCGHAIGFALWTKTVNVPTTLPNDGLFVPLKTGRPKRNGTTKLLWEQTDADCVGGLEDVDEFWATADDNGNISNEEDNEGAYEDPDEKGEEEEEGGVCEFIRCTAASCGRWRFVLQEFLEQLSDRGQFVKTFTCSNTNTQPTPRQCTDKCDYCNRKSGCVCPKKCNVCKEPYNECKCT